MSFRYRHRAPRHLAALLCLLAWGMALLPITALAQNIPGLVAASTAEDTWKPPDITALSTAWWTNFTAGPEESFNQRTRLLVQSLEERSKSLGPDDQVAAQAGIANLKSLFELLAVARAGALEEQFAPVPAREAYSLGEFLQLRHQGRELASRKAQVDLQIEQTQSQLILQKEQRDNLLRRYQAADVESPARILLGINRVTARVEYALNEARAKNLQKRLKQIDEQVVLLDEHSFRAPAPDPHRPHARGCCRRQGTGPRLDDRKIGRGLLLEVMSENPVTPAWRRCGNSR
jgi:hypothetical protein